MKKIENTVAYRYSPHPPEFYRFQGTNAPLGIGCGPIAEDAGLWNLAWLSMDKPYAPYEQFLEDRHLPMTTCDLIEYVAALGAVVINGEKLKVWAAQLPAKKLMKLFAGLPPTKKHPNKEATWTAWIAFANYRSRSSADAVVDHAEFEPVKSYATLVEEARKAEVIVRALPKPGLPIFTKTMPNQYHPPYKKRMSVLQYSPLPAAFYTVLVGPRRFGLGSGPCASDPGLWNIVWLTLAQVDEHEAEEPDRAKIGTWSDEFLKPFTDTAAYELSGTAIGDLATMMHARGFVDYLLTHPNTKSIPLVIKYGAGILVTMCNRAMKAEQAMSSARSRVFVRNSQEVNRAI